jgi:hypothetical protein
MNHWIGVVSHSHVLRGVAGGFAQMNHGKQAPLKRMKAGDGLIYYSPREAHPDGVPGFVPWRIDVDFLPAQSAPIKPLIAQLEFIKDKTHWGAAFRFGQVRIGEVDFRCIAHAMGCLMRG